MKSYLFVLSIVTALSCNDATKSRHHTSKPTDSEIVVTAIQQLLDTANLSGSILIYDAREHTYYSNDFNKANQPVLPASTFKIPNSIIGLETGLIKNENYIFKWDGEKRAMSQWEKDLTLKEAFQVSCVPCYQELARNIGVDTMRAHLERLKYPGMDVKQENIDMFWLVGASKISPMQQVNFLEKLYYNQLQISSGTFNTMKQIMKADSTEEYSLSAKSGWGVTDENNIGWYVGYIQKDENQYFFATCIIPNEDFDMGKFIAIRKQIPLDSFKALGLL